MSNPSFNTAGELTVIELRNYVLKPGLRDRFINYFENNFIQSQNELGANILGVYRVKGADDNFLWIRGFTDMESRSKFLPAFYYGDFWKAHRESANAMLANNDNVYLLKPLTLQNDTLVMSHGINFNQFTRNTGIAVVEFYIANTKLCKLIKLFSENYLPLIKNAGIKDYSLWVSEMEENTFPQLPVFPGSKPLSHHRLL
jgi:NIPSNAP.